MAISTCAAITQFTAHGGRIDLAQAAFPGVPTWTDLSTGIAPWRYPAQLDRVDLVRLPDPSAIADLEALAASAFGCSPHRMVAVPGTDLALRLLGAILPGRAGWVAPGYSGHEAMWPPDRAHAVRRTALTDAADTHRAVVLARPNNPDAWVADRPALQAAAHHLSARGGHLIVDEAFVDATPEDSLSGCDWPGLIVLRSFGKFFGLAGVRLGFVLAPPDVVQRFRALLGDWPVSAPAIAIGSAAYADLGWQTAQRKRLREGAQRMADLLGAAGLGILGQTAFFTLVGLPARDLLFHHLACSGILARPFAAEPEWLRLGVPGDEAGWARLTMALASWRQS
jgi:cobalamin biosynthesis protein CobC